MGGIPIVAVGYEISSDTLGDYLSSNDMLVEYGMPNYKKFLNHLESFTSTPVHLVHLEDNCDPQNTSRHTYLCCYADYRDKVYDCEEVMQTQVPRGFEKIQEILETKGEVRRVFGAKGVLRSYGIGGQSRVREHGLVI